MQGIKYSNATPSLSLLNKYYKLAQDIDASSTVNWNSGAGFEPIGRDIFFNSFTGSFFGNQHIITGLTINRPTINSGVGLFGFINNFPTPLSNTTIRDLGLVNSFVVGQFNVGSLAGVALSVDIINCYNIGSISGFSQVGGLIGLLGYSSLINSYNVGNVVGTSDFVGGLTGVLADSSIINSYNASTVSGNNAVGGLVGTTSALDPNIVTLSNSYNIGKVSGNNQVGGLIGSTFETTSPGLINLNTSYSSGLVTGNSSVGTVIGSINNSLINISNLYWNTDITGALPAVGASIIPLPPLTGALPTKEMTESENFVGFNFSSGGVWNIVQNQTYPFFQWRFAPLYGTSDVLGVPVEAFLNGSFTPYNPTHEFGPSVGVAIEGVTSPINGQYYILIDNSTHLSLGNPIVVSLNNPSTPVSVSTTYNPMGMLVDLFFIPRSTIQHPFLPPVLLPQTAQVDPLAPEDDFPDYVTSDGYFAVKGSQFIPWINQIVHRLSSRHHELKIICRDDKGKDQNCSILKKSTK